MPESGLNAVYTWQPPFAVSGATLPISFGLSETNSKQVTVLTSGGATQSAMYDEANGLWNAVVDVPGDAVGELELTIELTEPDGTRRNSQPTRIPIVTDGDPIKPNIINIPSDLVSTYEWGSGPDNVGYEPAVGDSGMLQPTSMAIDPTAGLLVLDTVNHRIIVDGAVMKTIDLPGDDVPIDLVVNGASGTAAVLAYSNNSADLTATVYVVDLADESVETFGPIGIPRTTPLNTELTWSPTNIVYARVGPAYYPFFDLDQRTILIGQPAISGLETSVDIASDEITVGTGTSTITIAGPAGFAGISDVQIGDDGTIWLLNAAIDPSTPEAETNYYLTRIDPVTRTAISTPIAQPGLPTVVKQLAIDGDTATIMRADYNLIIERYTLPSL